MNTSKWLTWPVVIGVIVVGIALWFGSAYNGFVRSNEGVDAQWAQVESQYQRRFDLIPNLVETVKGYMVHERATLEAVIAARSQAAGALGALGTTEGAMLGAASITQLANASTALDGALGRLIGLVERYPELKANQNALQLQEELASTENRIAFARQAYNDAVMRLNEQIVVFPASVVARTFGITEMGLFEADAAARAAVAVKF